MANTQRNLVAGMLVAMALTTTDRARAQGGVAQAGTPDARPGFALFSDRIARSSLFVRVNTLKQAHVAADLDSNAPVSSVQTTPRGISASDPVVEQIRDVIGVVDPIRVVDPAEFPSLPAIATKVAFRLTRRTADGNHTVDPVIYLVRVSWAYQRARSGSSNAVYLLASSVVHEIAHGHGANELSALSAQRDLLVKLTALPIRTEKLMFLRDQIRQIETRIEVEKVRPTVHETYVVNSEPSR
jgi:hypothetical protein